VHYKLDKVWDWFIQSELEQSEAWLKKKYINKFLCHNKFLWQNRSTIINVDKNDENQMYH